MSGFPVFSAYAFTCGISASSMASDSSVEMTPYGSSYSPDANESERTWEMILFKAFFAPPRAI